MQDSGKNQQNGEYKHKYDGEPKIQDNNLIPDTTSALQEQIIQSHVALHGIELQEITQNSPSDEKVTQIDHQDSSHISYMDMKNNIQDIVLVEEREIIDNDLDKKQLDPLRLDEDEVKNTQREQLDKVDDKLVITEVKEQENKVQSDSIMSENKDIEVPHSDLNDSEKLNSDANVYDYRKMHIQEGFDVFMQGSTLQVDSINAKEEIDKNTNFAEHYNEIQDEAWQKAHKDVLLEDIDSSVIDIGRENKDIQEVNAPLPQNEAKKWESSSAGNDAGSHSKRKIKKAKKIQKSKHHWNYVLYSKRLFLSIAVLACFVCLYTGYLFFGSISFEVLWNLQETRDELVREVEESRLENANLQKQVLELKALEPQ